jgi:hypothetical protein
MDRPVLASNPAEPVSFTQGKAQLCRLGRRRYQTVEPLVLAKGLIPGPKLLIVAPLINGIRIELAALASSSARWLHVPEAKTCARYRHHSQ